MVNLQRFTEHQQSRKLRTRRYFSEDFKKKKVREIEKNLTTVSQLSKEYSVSDTAIYKWIHKYSMNMKKGVVQIVEAKSDTVKIQNLKEQVKELERLVGQKQIIIEFQQKMIELAENDLGIEIKKKYGSKPSSGSGQTEINTLTK
jgi:transposase-like protein